MIKQIRLNSARYEHTRHGSLVFKFLQTTMMLRNLTMKMETLCGWMLPPLRWLNLMNMNVLKTLVLMETAPLGTKD
jgi:hypothetical protein